MLDQLVLLEFPIKYASFADTYFRSSTCLSHLFLPVANVYQNYHLLVRFEHNFIIISHFPRCWYFTLPHVVLNYHILDNCFDIYDSECVRQETVSEIYSSCLVSIQDYTLKMQRRM